MSINPHSNGMSNKIIDMYKLVSITRTRLDHKRKWWQFGKPKIFWTDHYTAQVRRTGEIFNCPQEVTQVLVSILESMEIEIRRELGAPALLDLVLQVGKLQDFKTYVHKRLDEAGIPVDPPGEHSAAGCRVGQRLDIALEPQPIHPSDEDIERIAQLYQQQHERSGWKDEVSGSRERAKKILMFARSIWGVPVAEPPVGLSAVSPAGAPEDAASIPHAGEDLRNSSPAGSRGGDPAGDEIILQP